MSCCSRGTAAKQPPLECGRRRLAQTRGELHRFSRMLIKNEDAASMMTLRILPGPPAQAQTLWDRFVRHTSAACLSLILSVRSQRTFPSNLETTPVIAFFPLGLLVSWLGVSCNLCFQNGLNVFHSCEVFRFTFNFLPLLILSVALIPRTAAGIPALPSLPRTSCHCGLYFALDVQRNFQEKRIAKKRTLSAN